MSQSRVALPKWADIVVLPALNLVVAFLVCGLIVLAIGVNPVHAIGIMLHGAVANGTALGFTLFYTTNFVFAGLAVATAFQAKMFNIGGEGQATIGGIGILVATILIAPLSGFIALPATVLFATIFGALWGIIAGWLQAKRGSHIVITTIMLNFIAASILVWLLGGPLIEQGQYSPQSALLPEHLWLPKINYIFAVVGIDVSKSPLNISFVFALVSLWLFWILVWRTRFGFAIRTIGENPDAAHYAGVNVPRTIIITMAISGAFAGLLAVNEILGVSHRVVLNFTAGYGFIGIAVALMGRNHPFGILVASLLFGVLIQGGGELDFEFQIITREMVLLIQGLIVLFSGALAYMFSPVLEKLISNISSRKGG